MIQEVDQPSKELSVAIVLPYLNEQETLAYTCHSLGFGIGIQATPQSVTLFLIDNGSTDDSTSIAEDVKRASLEGSVIIGHELERGYVPPRHCGNILAQILAQNISQRDDNVLVLQADADTYYNKEYIDAMRYATQISGTDVLIEARTSYPSDFRAGYPSYIKLCDEVDEGLAQLFVSPESDVIVDDKVSGYRLSNYFGWGCHRREYAASGDEIHSETARLYMKARARGAVRFSVDSALASPSLRKVLQEPALHFASAGFPREASWNEEWRETYSGPTTIDDFCYNISHPEVQRAIQVREQHLIAIFCVLPLHVNYSINRFISPETSELAAIVMPLLPKRTIDELALSPGLFISDVFELMDHNGVELLGECRRLISTIPRF